MKNRKLTRRDANEAGLSLITFVLAGAFCVVGWGALATGLDGDGVNMFEFIVVLVTALINVGLTCLAVFAPFNFYNALFSEKAWYSFTDDDDYKDKKKAKPKKRQV